MRGKIESGSFYVISSPYIFFHLVISFITGKLLIYMSRLFQKYSICISSNDAIEANIFK